MALIKLFWDICWFKKGPQSVPYSMFLLALSLALYVLVGFILLIVEADFIQSILQANLEAMMMLGFVWAILSFTNLMERYVQTAIALLATDALISGFALPLLIWTQMTSEAQSIYLVLVLLMFWHVAVMAYILSHALSKPFLMGVGLSFVYVMSSYEIISLLFPSV